MSQVIIQEIDFHQSTIQEEYTHVSTRNKSP